MSEKENITILIAPLDWGLGHATRCIPIINLLLKLQCNVIVATSGKQHNLLKTEFPNLTYVHLPGYDIRYSLKKRFFDLKIILQLPKLFNSVKNEKKWLNQFVILNNINAVISDNRYGFFHISAQSVFITHQLQINAPFTFIERILQKISYRYINQFSACWVPDQHGKVNLAGKLSHPSSMPSTPVKYLGILSRFSPSVILHKQYKLLIVLSGPEPQRTLLEKKLIQQLKNFEGRVLFIRGLPGVPETLKNVGNTTFCNHLSAKEMEQAFLQCEYLISRCGYTTIMDICTLKVKSILIPTPGQTEQEYLARHCSEMKLCITTTQNNFNLNKLLEAAENFEYSFPQLQTNTYEQVVTDFVQSLKDDKKEN